MYGNGTDAEGNRVNSDLDLAPYLAPFRLEAAGKKDDLRYLDAQDIRRMNLL